MNIIIATPIMYDEKSPFNHLFKDILESFIKDGNHITRIVACEKDKDDGYTLGIVSDHITYIKLKRKGREKSNIILRYITDSIMNIRMAYKILKLKDADVLFEDVSYSSFWSILAAKIKSIKVVSMIQDVWPDNAVQSGLIKEKSLIYYYFDIWQRYVYEKSERIICISDDIKDFIASKGVSSDKITVIYNWGYSDEVIDINWETNQFVKKYDLDRNKFYAVYAGNIGRMQNIEIIVKAAYELKDNPNIHFLIVGDGVNRDNVTKLVDEYKLMNISMLPMQPKELATSIYSMASVNIIPLVKGGVKTALPSKIGVCLACSKPVLLCMDSDSYFAKTLVEYKAGYVVEPLSHKGLADSIINLYHKNEIKSSNVHSFFYHYFSMQANLKKYLKVIKKI